MKKTLILLLTLLLCAVLTACSAPVAEPKDCAAVSQAVLASQTFPENMTEQTAKRMLKVLGLEENQIAQGEMTLDASRVTAEAVVVLTVADQQQLAAVQAALEGYRQSMLMQYRDYKPAEVPKLEAAKVYTNGLQCALLIASDQNAAHQALEKAWK